MISVRKRILVCAIAVATMLFTGWMITASAEPSNGIKLLTQNSQAPTANTPATPPTLVPPAPNINAKAYVLMDADSGRIIAEKNMDQKRPPASLTKLMTLYIIAEALKQGQIHLNDKVRISKVAWSTGGSRMFLKLGSHVPVKDLVEGIIVASGNDACVAMSQYIAGTQDAFARLMNLTAARLGMKNTHYIDPTGLPRPDHYSSAHDLAILVRAIINDFPQYYYWYKQKWITWNGIRQPNRNRLLWREPGVDGLKTGHTKAAGYCLITSGIQHGMRLISVVMGTPSDAARSNDSQALLNWGFRFYNTHKLFSANQPITKPRVWMAESKYVPMGLQKPLYVTTAMGQYKNLKAALTLTPNLKAPINAGQTYGQVKVTLNGKVVATAPVIALKSDSEGGAWSRMIDHIEMFFKRWL